MNNRKWGPILLAIWLIVIGAAGLLNLTFTGMAVITNILAIAAGVLLILDR